MEEDLCHGVMVCSSALKDAFEKRYSKGKSNLDDARSSAGKNGLIVVYGVDPTQMAKYPELAESVAEKRFQRVYLIHPRYTNWERLWEKEAKIASNGPAKKEKPREQALKDEEEAQKKPYMIKQNKGYLKLLMKSAVKMIDQDSRVILLHPTEPPYSDWGINTIAYHCMLKYEKGIPFEAARYPGFCPKRAGTDLKLDLITSAFTYYQLQDKEEEEGEGEEEEEEEKEKEEGVEEEGDSK